MDNARYAIAAFHESVDLVVAHYSTSYKFTKREVTESCDSHNLRFAAFPGRDARRDSLHPEPYACGNTKQDEIPLIRDAILASDCSARALHPPAPHRCGMHMEALATGVAEASR